MTRSYINGAELPPHSIDAERGVISSLMLAADEPKLWEETIGIAQEKLVCAGREIGCQFYEPACRAIYRAMIDLDANNCRPDMVLLSSRLRELGVLEQIGGYAALSQLATHSPSAHQIPLYID